MKAKTAISGDRPRCDGCGKLANLNADGSVIPLKSCARCKRSAYHNIDCQKSHYREHKVSCRVVTSSATKTPRSTRHKAVELISNDTFRVEERPGRGKSMIAQKDLHYGDVIAERPAQLPCFDAFIPSVLMEGRRMSNCAWCFAHIKVAEEKVQLSSLENYPVVVCSQTCLEASKDWLPQEIRCVDLVCRHHDGGPPVFLPSALLLYRILLGIASNVVSRKDILSMQWHNLPLDDEAKNHQACVVGTVQALIMESEHFIDEKAKKRLLEIRPSDVVNLVAIIKFNGFHVLNETLEKLGVGLFKTAHQINHSCKPNVIQTFLYGDIPGRPPRVKITACANIPTGEEIVICYTEYWQPGKLRRAELKERYNFCCNCVFCNDETREAAILGVKCSKSHCAKKKANVYRYGRATKGSASLPSSAKSRTKMNNNNDSWFCSNCGEEPAFSVPKLLASLDHVIKDPPTPETPKLHTVTLKHFHQHSFYRMMLSNDLLNMHTANFAKSGGQGHQFATQKKLFSDLKLGLTSSARVSEEYQGDTPLRMAELTVNQSVTSFAAGRRVDESDLLQAEKTLITFYSEAHPIISFIREILGKTSSGIGSKKHSS